MTEQPPTPADEQPAASDGDEREQPTARGEDERRQAVNPADNPAPSSPEADDEAVRKAEEVLERVKPY